MIQEREIIAAVEEFKKKSETPLNLEAIFFDMDGVLYNSMPSHAKAWTETLKEHDLEIPEFEPYMNEGSTAFFTVRKMFKKYLQRDADDQLCDEIKDRKHEIMASMPPAEVMVAMPELLTNINNEGIDCWVVTGSAQNILIDRLAREYENIFQREKMITAHDVKIGKPHPEPYLMAMQKSGYNTSNSIVVENAPLGVQSSVDAGLFTIAINTGPLDPKALIDAGANIVLAGSKELYDLWPIIFKALKQ